MDKQPTTPESELIESEGRDQLLPRVSRGERSLLNLFSHSVSHVEQDLLKANDINLEGEMVDLYHAIESLFSGKKQKIIQFIGSRKGEGTSTIVREFARVAAIIMGKSVLLMDTDFPQSIPDSLATAQGKQTESCEKRIPLRCCLDQAEDPYYSIGSISLFETSLPAVFNSPHIDQLLERLKQQFDIILVDSPPASYSSDVMAIARKVEGVVLIVAAEDTRWPVVESVKNKIEKVGGNLLGVILNKKRHYIPSFIYERL